VITSSDHPGLLEQKFTFFIIKNVKKNFFQNFAPFLRKSIFSDFFHFLMGPKKYFLAFLRACGSKLSWTVVLKPPWICRGYLRLSKAVLVFEKVQELAELELL